jgi:hypothetical protein
MSFRSDTTKSDVFCPCHLLPPRCFFAAFLLGIDFDQFAQNAAPAFRYDGPESILFLRVFAAGPFAPSLKP